MNTAMASNQIETTSGRILRCPLGPSKVIPTNGFGETLLSGLTKFPSRCALINVSTSNTISYKEFLNNVEAIARRLVFDLGCKPGDVIAIFSPNSIEWMLMATATMRIGAVLAAVNHMLTPDELRYQLSLCHATVLYTINSLMSVTMEAFHGTELQKVIVNRGNKPERGVSLSSLSDTLVNWSDMLSLNSEHIHDLPETSDLGVESNDPAMILFSSGTTGPQKAVVLSHRNIHAQMVISCDRRVKKIQHNEIMFAPFAHIKGCLFTLYNLAFGHTTFIMSRFNLNDYLRLVERNKLESLSVVPVIAIQLAKSPDVDKYDMSHVKEIVCGTAPLRQEVEEILRRRFPGVKLRQAYGLTETASIVTSIPNDMEETFAATKMASVGVPLYNTQIKVIDLLTGCALGPNEDGEICIKSPTVMLGYAGNSKATAEAVDHDGWLHTGDVGHYDEDGFLFIVDRIKELIKYKSYQVAPAELEAVLLSHAGVADAGVVGLPDAMSGELPVAMVVLRNTSSASETDLLGYVADRVAPYKRLRGGIRFVATIPRSPTGKILRREIKDRLLVSRQ